MLLPEASSLSRLAREYLSGSCASSITAIIFNPLEVVKTRLQLQDMPGWTKVYHGNPLATLIQIHRQDGLLRLWSHGLAAIVARDFVYSGVRTGMYPSVRDVIARNKAVGDATFAEKVAAGALTGSIGAAFGNPFDVVRVRMIADGGRVDADGVLRTGLRQGHAARWAHSIDCLREAAARTGIVRGLLMRGLGASASRAGLLTAAQMSTYDHTKTLAKRTGFIGEGIRLHVLAAAISGLAATIACNPADVLKSRVMAGAGAAGGSVSTVGALVQIVRYEGLATLYRGFLPAYARIGPTILIQLPIAERLRTAFGVRGF